MLTHGIIKNKDFFHSLNFNFEIQFFLLIDLLEKCDIHYSSIKYNCFLLSVFGCSKRFEKQLTSQHYLALSI